MSFLIPKSRRVNLVELTESIRAGMSYTRWENTQDKQGFAGLTMATVNINGTPYYKIDVVVTNDGKMGYVRYDYTDKELVDINIITSSHDAGR